MLTNTTSGVDVTHVRVTVTVTGDTPSVKATISGVTVISGRAVLAELTYITLGARTLLHAGRLPFSTTLARALQPHVVKVTDTIGGVDAADFD